MMNRHAEFGMVLGLTILFSLIILTNAAPPNPPITSKGFVMNSTNMSGPQMPELTNVSINDTNTSMLVATVTSGGATLNTGFYHADINGTDGDVLKVIGYNNTDFGYNSSSSLNNVVTMNITINDSRVAQPVPILPANLSLLLTRAPTFAWNNSFDQVNNTGMVRNYTLQIADDLAFTTNVVNVSDINESTGTNTNTTYNLTFDLAVGTHFWRVQARQLNTSATSRFSHIFNFTIVTAVACALAPGAVDFGTLLLGGSNNTLNNAPFPIVIKNSGNVLENVSINATNLWNDTTAQMPSRFYQWKIADNTTNSFVAANTTIFLNMSNVSQQTIQSLRYLNITFTSPAARVELNITSTAQEAPGSKSSNILLTCTG